MSVSGISDSSLSSLSPELLARMRGSGAQPPDDEEFANSFMEEKDCDGDGLLSLEEAGTDEEHFLSVDTDGDGFMSQEEILADLEQRHQQMAAMGELGMFMQGMTVESLVDSILAENDEDGDGSLNLEEAGLSEKLFGSLDIDGDGQISAAELEEALRPPEEIAGMGPPPQETAETASTSGASGAQSSGDSSGSSDEEEYDGYDYNQDGTVSMDELRQAFLNGDLSLEELFAKTGDSQDGQSPFMRMAMNAYRFQSQRFSTDELLLSVA